MRHRVDPDALYYALALRWGYADAAQVCPEVAEPERSAEPVSDRCDCAMFGFTHTRMECDEYRDKSAEPVIDEAVYEAAANIIRPYFRFGPDSVLTSEERAAVTAAVLKDRELRSESCGGSDCSSSGSCGLGTVSVEPTPKNSTAAHAADPRRLTNAEIELAYMTDKTGEQLRAVADLQLAKADAAAKPVTISEAEIERFLESGLISAIRRDGWRSGDADAIANWLRSKGVEVSQ